MYDNDNGWQKPNFEKIENKSIWQRYRLQIVMAVGLLLLIIFASSTVYLLLNRPSPTPAVATAATPTAAATVAPTTVAAQPTQARQTLPQIQR
ncbi:hypothetical protein [Dictyobacter kobayashii]|uniref:Uncharacterized protein n=1 Tax=Dictyobacter kobayashii TaxID=2014872 RepID=A0A402AQE2_9CHLR|nr:hypothetical protein [Dictyobacter kobayashii]GCE21391.1 hypothetical protein KDK_51910 [Dictyobacter kobayashii]